MNWQGLGTTMPGRLSILYNHDQRRHSNIVVAASNRQTSTCLLFISWGVGLVFDRVLLCHCPWSILLSTQENSLLNTEWSQVLAKSYRNLCLLISSIELKGRKDFAEKIHVWCLEQMKQKSKRLGILRPWV